MLNKILHNSLWNIVGQALPMFVAIPCLGFIARAIGVESFGIFTLIFAIVGYANIFDAGLSRAVIRQVSKYQDDKEKIKIIISTSSVIVLALSLVAAVLLFVFSDNLASILSVSDAYVAQAVVSFKIISLSIPALLLTFIFNAYFEGLAEFKLLNKQKIIANILLSSLPVVMVSVFEPSLSICVMGLLIGRWLSLCLAFYFLVRDFRKNALNLKFKEAFEKSVAVDLFKFGSWITVSNIISPIMVYFDRFILSSINGTQNLAFYTVPSELITKSLIFPSAITRVLFPIFCSSSKKLSGSLRQVNVIMLMMFGFMTAGVSILMVFSGEILTLWVGHDFSGQPALVFNILLCGLVFTSIAQIPYARIQAYGYSKLTAYIHLAEVIPYLILLYLMVTSLGIIGAALSWTIRVLVDLIVLYVVLLNVSRKNNMEV